MGLEATTLVWWMGGPKKSSGKIGLDKGSLQVITPSTDDDLRYHRGDNTYPECNEQVVVSTSDFNTALEFKPLFACHSPRSGRINNWVAVGA
jgi:hypothetical protein